MKFLLDTNALIYALYRDSKEHEEIIEFIKQAIGNRVTCYFLSSSLKDAYYVLCKHYHSESDSRKNIKMLRDVLDMVELSACITDEAFQSDESDFEDGIIRAAAESLQVDAIITYDKDAFKSSIIPKMTALEALQKICSMYSQVFIFE